MVELFSKSSWCPEATPLVALRGVRNTRVELVQLSSSGAFRGKLTVCRYRKNLPVGDFSAACTETACIRTTAPKLPCCPYRFLVFGDVSQKGICFPACAGALSCDSIKTALLPLSFFSYIVFIVGAARLGHIYVPLTLANFCVQKFDKKLYFVP